VHQGLRGGGASRAIAQQETERADDDASITFRQEKRSRSVCRSQPLKEFIMTKEQDNKAIVGRWFTDFWGKTCNLSIVDELAAPNMLLQYSLHEPRRGREDIKAFMTGFRKAFPDLNFWGATDLIAEGDYVVGRWEGGGTHTGPAFADFLIGSLPAATGKKMHFTGTTVLRLQEGKIVEEVGLDDGVTALQQLGLVKAA
jgi:predicted ester cyclase